jgi:hypothetical protein
LSALTVDDVLDARCVYTHTHEVRSIAPAIVLVIEHGAPMRLEIMYSTESELNALTAGISPAARKVMESYFEAKEEEEGIEHTDLWLREEAHAERLAAGVPTYSSEGSAYEQFRRTLDEAELGGAS